MPPLESPCAATKDSTRCKEDTTRCSQDRTQPDRQRNLERSLDLTDLEEELMVARWKGRGEGIVRAFGMGVCTVLYSKWIANKGLLYRTGNAAQCYVAAWMEGEFGGEWVRVCVRLSPFAVHLKLSQHC